MSESSTKYSRRAVTLIFDRDISDDELEQMRQKTDALAVRAAGPDAAHHHDVTPEQ